MRSAKLLGPVVFALVWGLASAGSAGEIKSLEIENKISKEANNAFGAFKFSSGDVDMLQVKTIPKPEKECADAGQTKVTFYPESGDLVTRYEHVIWTNTQKTEMLNMWRSATPLGGERVYVTIRGYMRWDSPGGAGTVVVTKPSPPPPRPTWLSSSIDLVLDADFDHDGKITEPVEVGDKLDYSKVVAERKLKNDEKANPYGAFVVVGQRSDLILRQIQPRLTPEYKGTVSLIQCAITTKPGQPLEVLKEPMVRVFKGATELQTISHLGPTNLWDAVQNEDLPLTVEGVSPGKFMLVAAYGCPSKGVSFMDYSRVTVLDVELKLMLGHIDPVTGRGMAGTPEQVLYEPESGDKAMPDPSSNPSPYVTIAKLEVINVRGNGATEITGDLKIEGEAVFALSDVIEDGSADLKEVTVEIGGYPLHKIVLKAHKEPASILRPYAKHFSFDGSFKNTPLALYGFNSVVVKCKDPVIGNVGRVAARIEVKPSVSATEYDEPMGNGVHPLIATGMSQPLKVRIDLSAGGSLAELVGLGKQAIPVRAKIAFANDPNEYVASCGLSLLADGGAVVESSKKGDVEITIADASALKLDDDVLESFTAEVLIPGKWPDRTIVRLCETAKDSRVFESCLITTEMRLGEELGDQVLVRWRQRFYDSEIAVGGALLFENDAEPRVFVNGDGTTSLRVLQYMPGTGKSFGFMRIAATSEVASFGEQCDDVGQIYIQSGTYDSTQLFREVPNAVDARLALAKGPWEIEGITILPSSNPGPYIPVVARLRAAESVLKDMAENTECVVFDRPHKWVKAYGEVWCGGSPSPGVFVQSELPVPDGDFGAGHVDSDFNYIFFSTRGKKIYEVVKTERKDFYNVASKVLDKLCAIAEERRRARLAPAGDPGATYPSFAGSRSSKPKAYMSGVSYWDPSADNSLGATVEDALWCSMATGKPLPRPPAQFLSAFSPSDDKYFDLRRYFAASILDFLHTARQEYAACPPGQVPANDRDIADLAIEKLAVACGKNPIIPSAGNAMYFVTRPHYITEGGTEGKPAAIAVGGLMGLDPGHILLKFPGDVHGHIRVMSVAMPMQKGECDRLALQRTLTGLWKCPVPVLTKDGKEVVKNGNVVKERLAAEQVVHLKYVNPMYLTSIGSQWLLGQHAPFLAVGTDDKLDPLSNSQNITQVLHHNTGMVYRTLAGRMNGLVAVLESHKSDRARAKAVLEYIKTNGLLTRQEQARLDAYTGFVSAPAAAYISTSARQLKEGLVVLKMTQAWKKLSKSDPTPLDFFTAYDIASGEGFMLFGIDAFDDVIATQGGYLFHDELRKYPILSSKRSNKEHVAALAGLVEEQMALARKEFRRHPALNWKLGDEAKGTTPKKELVRSFFAMQLTQARVGSPFNRRWKFVPVTLKMGPAGSGGEGGLWGETIGTIVEANMAAGKLTYDDPRQKGRLDPNKVDAFVRRLESVVKGLTISTYEGADGILNQEAVIKLQEMVEVLMFLDEDPD